MRYNDVVRNRSGSHTVSNRNAEVADHALDDFSERVGLAAGLNAIQHLTEYETTDPFKFAGELQLHEHAIDLEWLGANILEEKDGVAGLNFVLSCKRCNQHG